MKKGKKFLIVLLFLLVASAAFFGIQYFTKTGFFKIYGVVEYDASVTAEEKTLLSNILESDAVRLEHDVKISAQNLTSADNPTSSILYAIYLPVANFYDIRSTISADELNALDFDQTKETYLIKSTDLDSTVKLLAVDDNYYLDSLTSGAIFRYLTFDSRDTSEAIALVSASYAYENFSNENILSFAQTGVTALSRGMYSKLKKVGSAAYFAEKIQDFLSSKDLTHISNEASFSSSASGSNICSAWDMFSAIEAIGTDIVELTGNHNNDCGAKSNLESIAYYKEKGIMTVGGGENATAAAVPLEISKKNTNITMLAYNYSTGGYTTGNNPGANLYSEAKAKADISAAKERGDFVIVDFQYFECYCYPTRGTEMTACDKTIASSEYGEYPNQEVLFKQLIDMGANVVVGTSAHQPQTYETYNGGEIYYGLGNLFFDQTMWPGTTRGIILTHYFNNGKLLQTRFSPTVYDTDLQVRLMDEEESEWLIKRLNAAR